MRGEKDLSKLLSKMKPVLSDGEYVICTFDDANSIPMTKKPLMIFKEEEGTTFILSKKIADSMSIEYASLWSMITLSVHSDLEAVGFIAEVSKHLAKAGISVNVVSAYYHDHLFVLVDKAQRAMDVLQKLSDEAKSS